MFVKAMRTTEMRFGVAIDKRGNRWRGFHSRRSYEDVLHTGVLGDVGICMLCADRVYDGWHCEKSGSDLCKNCVLIKNTFVVQPHDWDENKFFQK